MRKKTLFPAASLPKSDGLAVDNQAQWAFDTGRVGHTLLFGLDYQDIEVGSAQTFAAFMQGSTPLTSKLLTPVLIDAESAEVAATAEMPWTVSTLMLSQPLHFGDYGGMPLKILWAVLDLITIIVLATGIYLWLQRREPVVRSDRAIEAAAAGASSQ